MFLIQSILGERGLLTLKVSMKFNHIEKHLMDILNLICMNQKIKRYLKYLSEDPLTVRSAQPDIQDDLINENILITPFHEKALKDDKALMFINPNEGNLEYDDIGEEMYTIDIVLPVAHWRLHDTGELRVFRIAAEIAKLIDGKEVTGIGKVNITKFKCLELSESFAGITISVKVNTSTRQAFWE